MQVEDCYQLGYISKTHGLHGHVVAVLDTDNPQEYENLESVFLLKDLLIPFFLSSLELKGNKIIARFEDVDSLDKAKELVGLELYLPLSELPELKGNNQYYFHDLLDCEVFENGSFLGKIEKVYQPSSQFVASVTVRGKELLLPIEDQIFTQVNIKEKRVDVTIPDGLKEIYL